MAHVHGTIANPDLTGFLFGSWYSEEAETKQKPLIAAVGLAIILIFAISSASAQSFSTVLEKLDQIEARLNQLEKAQTKDAQKLHGLLSQVQSGGSGQDLSALSGSVNAVQTRIEELTQDVEQLKANSSSSRTQAYD